MIDTGYFAKIKTYPKTDILVVVSLYYDRYAPRGLLHKQELAPSEELFNDWKAGVITWEEYETRYRAQMDDPVVQRLLKQYSYLVASKKVHRFICYEKEPPCHRFILKDMVEDLARTSRAGCCVNCGYYMIWKYSREDMLKRGRERRCSKCGESYDVKKLPADTLLTYFKEKKEASR